MPGGSFPDPFALESAASTGAGARKAARAGKKAGSVELANYVHPERRKNNPEVGIVHADGDPDSPPATYAYDPHIDPALQFDVGRAAVERLIDDALASGDAERMRAALAELKRAQAPYLNWAGKAERTSFAVDTVSLHVHERIDPATILSAIRKSITAGQSGVAEPVQPWLFDAPFEALPLRQALDFYGHDKGWANRLIAGDSLLVMNSLLKKESMAGQVQMIYFDPPYGIKYGSNFQPFTSKRDVKDGADADLTQEPEMLKAFRDTWELGIHSYLTYLRDRIFVARELLRESGSFFIQISDENVHLVRNLLDDISGPENFISQINFSKTGSVAGQFLGTVCDNLLFYAKDATELKYRALYEKKGKLDDEPSEDPLKSDGFRSTTTIAYSFMGKSWPCARNEHWKVTVRGLDRVAKADRIVAKRTSLRLRKRNSDFGYKVYHSIWLGFGGAAGMRYVVETSPRIIERALLMTTDPGDLVFDPTCGSGTTAVVAEKWGRRWITCDTSRVAVTLAKQRLMTAGFDYYALRYPHEGLKGGFVYETVPHVKLESIANNAEIDAIWERMHPTIEAALASVNAALAGAPPFTAPQGVRKGQKVVFAKGETLHEWEIPFDFPDGWPAPARTPFDAFHAARLVMQRAMDKSIADHAESETLYDRPEVDPAKVRVAGPFTVEAVPAPTVRSLEEPAPAADASIARSGETARQSDWRDELLKTGIRGKGGQILRLAGLEVLPGCKALHASGALADDGRRVVVSFGPEYAELDQRQVERALEEAASLVPKPAMVIFCAFAFDSEAAKDIDEAKFAGVTLLKAQMNTDLFTEDLKKKRSSNQSFWLMGQPDVELVRDGDRWRVEVRGFDYFDTRSGELVSGGVRNIAMWSLDTDYDGRALFPRQTFFPMAGAKDGWNRLKASIRAELDSDLLAQFHGAVSRPFEAGEHRRAAVKIVDDRGIESLKILALDE